ncbi:glycosyltransferase family 4 protein [Butyrivibrio proteoclasticus]|uniref:glycosyltransferase family 4 protein n=1 Tax=Butyrivibrio proteoclasticus TaxID=43305 RepID=UPI0018CC0F57|nr:glycosyltransferase family 4 protein [Butyrivibrio proteoclasticus]
MSYNLLVISHCLNNTGAPLVLMDAIKVCLKVGYEVDVVSLEDGPLREKLEADGISVSVAYDFLDNLQMWQRTFERYDVVVANTLLCLEAIYVLNTVRVPTVWWIHEHEFWFQHYKEVLPKSSDLRPGIKVYGVSPITNQYITEYCGYNTGLMPFGIEDLKNRYECDDDLNKSGKVRFLLPATYSPVKGQDILCAAIALLPEDIKEKCEFIMCGAINNSEMDYRKKIGELGDKIKELTVLGALTHEDTLDLMNGCDYVVAPSRLEPFSATCVEAMMLGKVPIMSDVCGVTYWIDDGKNGIIFKSESVEALSKEIIRAVDIADNKAKYLDISNMARRTYEENFSIDAFAKRFINALW